MPTNNSIDKYIFTTSQMTLIYYQFLVKETNIESFMSVFIPSLYCVDMLLVVVHLMLINPARNFPCDRNSFEFEHTCNF